MIRQFNHTRATQKYIILTKYMIKDKIVHIGQLNKSLSTLIPNISKYSDVYKSEGLAKHVKKRHPECAEYLSLLPSIISAPDYIGVNPNERGVSFELVKVFDENIQIGIKLDVKEDYLYVATLHTITESKLKHRIESGRLKLLSLLESV